MTAAPPIIRAGPVNVPLDYTIPVNAEIMPLAVSATFADPTNAGPYVPALSIITPDGSELGPFPLGTSIAAGASARVSWFPGGDLDQEQAQGTIVGVTQEVLYFDTTSSVPVSTVSVLAAGVPFVVVVEGTFSFWNQALPIGNPEANAMFPGATAGRDSTQVGLDADTRFAEPTLVPGGIGHSTGFQISLDGGSTFAHLEPVGGPFGTPQTGHLYRYELTGQGHIASFKVTDTPLSDNYGKLRITVQIPNGTGTGSGAGSLLPPADTTNNGQVATVLGGVPTWAAVDGGSP